MHLQNLFPTGLPVMIRFFSMLVLAAALSVAAFAQASPTFDFDFNDSTGGTVQYHSTGHAVVGVVTAYVRGHIRDSQVSSLSVNIGRFTGANKLEEFRIAYTKSPSVVAPSVRWYNVSATTKRLEIIRVPARQDFTGTAFSSRGYANVQITFVNGQPGKAVVSYTHGTYYSPYTNSTTPPAGVRAYSGTVMSGVPLNGKRLFYVTR